MTCNLDFIILRLTLLSLNIQESFLIHFRLREDLSLRLGRRNQVCLLYVDLITGFTLRIEIILAHLERRREEV